MAYFKSSLAQELNHTANSESETRIDKLTFCFKETHCKKEFLQLISQLNALDKL